HAGLRTSWGALPAGHWGKLLAAWQGMHRGRLVRRWCALRVPRRARQRRLKLLLGWPHRLFVRPRQRLTLRAGQGVARRVLKSTRLPRLRLLLGWGPRRDLTGLAFRRSWAAYHCRLLGHGGRQGNFRGDRRRRHASSDTCRRRQTWRRARVRRTRINVGAIVVDDCRVVDVIEDYIFRGRRHIGRGINPNGDRHEYWDWKHEKFNRRRRRQEDEIGRRRSEEDDWRRRHEAELRIVEHKHRAIDIDDLRRRRRRNVVDDRRVGGRRLLGGCQTRKAPARVGRVRTARIPVEIGPIGVRRIDHAGSPPGHRLAAGSHEATDTIGQRVGWIGAEKLLVAL